MINAYSYIRYLTRHPANAEASPVGRVTAGQGLMIIEASWSHSETLTHSVGLLWTSDKPGAETSI